MSEGLRPTIGAENAVGFAREACERVKVERAWPGVALGTRARSAPYPANGIYAEDWCGEM